MLRSCCSTGRARGSGPGSSASHATSWPRRGARECHELHSRARGAPAGMPKEAAIALKRTRVRGVPINLRPDTGRTDSRPDTGERKFRKKPERE